MARGKREESWSQQPRFLVIYEGAVTERDYLDSVKGSLRARGANLQMVPPGPTSPLEIVKKAILFRDRAARSDAYDQIWCVFDVEAKVEQQARPNLSSAISLAQSERISLCISNPCIELWILLHEEDQQSFIHSDACQRRCKDLGLMSGKYLTDADHLYSGYWIAKSRAEDLEAKHTRDGQLEAEDRNPSSTFYLLVDELKRHFDTN